MNTTFLNFAEDSDFPIRGSKIHDKTGHPQKNTGGGREGLTGTKGKVRGKKRIAPSEHTLKDPTEKRRESTCVGGRSTRGKDVINEKGAKSIMCRTAIAIQIRQHELLHSSGRRREWPAWEGGKRAPDGKKDPHCTAICRSGTEEKKD